MSEGSIWFSTGTELRRQASDLDDPPSDGVSLEDLRRLRDLIRLAHSRGKSDVYMSIGAVSALVNMCLTMTDRAATHAAEKLAALEAERPRRAARAYRRLPGLGAEGGPSEECWAARVVDYLQSPELHEHVADEVQLNPIEVAQIVDALLERAGGG